MSANEHERESVPWRPHEQLLWANFEPASVQSLLCNTAGRGQFAIEVATANPTIEVTCQLYDLFHFYQCATTRLPNLHWCCQADPPLQEFDHAALAIGQQGEAEFARELLQDAHARLRMGGALTASSDNTNDRWLGEQLRTIFDRVVRKTHESGTCFTAIKTGPLKRVRKFESIVAMRDHENLIYLKSRPGVFSHRRVDPGARALLRAICVEGSMRVLDLGCGSGAISLAVAARAPGAQILALDSNPRAIECLDWSKERNQLPNITAILDCDGSAIRTPPPDSWYGPGCFDLAAINPPYYSHFRIADGMIRTAENALSPEGQLLVVTKTPNWYAERLAETFHDVEFLDGKNYVVVRASRD